MTDFVTRTELDDVLAPLLKRVHQVERFATETDARRVTTAADVMRQREDLLLLRRLVLLLLSDEQRELLALEQRCGVTDSALADDAAVSAAEVAAFKAVGSLFVLPDDGAGPCYNR